METQFSEANEKSHQRKNRIYDRIEESTRAGSPMIIVFMIIALLGAIVGFVMGMFAG